MDTFILLAVIVPTLIIFTLLLLLLIKVSRDLFLAIFFQQKKSKNISKSSFVGEKNCFKSTTNKSNNDFLDFSDGSWGI